MKFYEQYLGEELYLMPLDSIFPDYKVAADGKAFLLPCQSQAKKRSITVAIQWPVLVRYPARQPKAPR